MIQKDKVALMTHLAIEEKNDPRFRYITRNYWFNDYITTEAWKAFFAISIVFALTVLLGLVAFGDDWTVHFHLADLVSLGQKLIWIYIGAAGVGILLCVLTHISRYKAALRKRETIREDLRKLSRVYALEDAFASVYRRSRGKTNG